MGWGGGGGGGGARSSMARVKRKTETNNNIYKYSVPRLIYVYTFRGSARNCTVFKVTQ